MRGQPFRFEKQRPAFAEALENVVETRGDRDELGLGRAVEIRATVAD